MEIQLRWILLEIVIMCCFKLKYIYKDSGKKYFSVKILDMWRYQLVFIN